MTEVIKTLEMLNMAKGVSGKSAVKKDYNHNGNMRFVVLEGASTCASSKTHQTWIVASVMSSPRTYALLLGPPA